MSRLHSALILSASALVLAACTANKPPPSIAYDDAARPRLASIEPEPPKLVQVVEVPKPLPLPGQLEPLPTADRRTPTARVADANKEALQEPTRDGYINAIQVYPFTEGALYRLYAAPEEVSDIALQPGESLTALSAGDTVRWTVGDTTSGNGESKQVHVLVKPFAASLKTNLVIVTDRRTYHLALESTDRTYMAALSWTYPQEELIAFKRKASEADAATPIEAGLAVENLRFRYAITGDSPPWRPVRVFDDGSKVYIAFPARLDQGEAPPLFVIGPDGKGELVNYRVKGSYYIVDRLFAAAELRLGSDPQQVVRIARTDAVATGNADAVPGFGTEPAMTGPR